MGWVYLDDRFPEHPKVQAAGDEAAWLYVAALAYVNRNGTLGDIPKTVVGRLTGLRSAAKAVARLVAVGLWHDKGDHYAVHDYVPFNRSAIARTEKARKAAEARWHTPVNHAPSNAQASPEHMLKHPPSNAHDPPPSICPEPIEQSPCASAAPAPSPKPLAVDLSSSSSATMPSIDDEAIRILARRRLETTPTPVGNPAAWLKTVQAALVEEHAEKLARRPISATAEHLADWLEPPAQPARASPQDGEQAARRAIMARNDLPPCDDCDSTGWAGGDPDNGKCVTCGRLG